MDQSIVQTSWNLKNFDALSWRMTLPLFLFMTQRLDGHSNKGMNILAVTSCLERGENIKVKKLQNNQSLTQIPTMITTKYYPTKWVWLAIPHNWEKNPSQKSNKV